MYLFFYCFTRSWFVVTLPRPFTNINTLELQYNADVFLNLAYIKTSHDSWSSRLPLTLEFTVLGVFLFLSNQLKLAKSIIYRIALPDVAVIYIDQATDS